jgi:DNA-binding beta-propeller fold protein YncE
MRPARHSRPLLRALGPLALAALLLPAGALAASAPQGVQPTSPQPTASPGTLVQLSGARGCLVDRSAPPGRCAPARALKEPATLLGSRAVALSPDGKSLYVAAAGSNAIAIFKRDPRTGTLTQGKGAAGCIAAKGANGCAPAVGLDGPNSVAVSPDGRNVYATSLGSEAVTAFHRDRSSGALSQSRDGSGCITTLPLPGCASGRALGGPDVIVASPDGRNVYVGSFFGNAIAVFNRDPSTGALTQPADSSGCIAAAPTSGCTTGLALEALEGMAISGDGKSLYVGAAVSEALDTFARNPATGALQQASGGGGCIVSTPLAGCTTGAQLDGADAVAVSPNGKDVYVTSLFSKSIASFSRSTASGLLTQKPGPSGCLVFMRSAGCSFGRALNAPEGLAVAPDGTNVYAASFAPGAVAVLNRNRRSGVVVQKPNGAGCVAVGSVPECPTGRAMSGLSSLVLSPDGRYLYAAAAKSDAIAVFRRTPRRAAPRN